MYMKKIIALLLAVVMLQAKAQKINKIINVAEVERIEQILSADDMEGRRTFSPGIDKAAKFIAAEFKKANLNTWNNSDSYLQSFVMVKANQTQISGNIDGVAIAEKNIVLITSKTTITINEKSGYELVIISKGTNFLTEARKYINGDKNYIVIADPSFANMFPRLQFIKRNMFKSDNSTLFLLGDKAPQTYSVSALHDITEQQLANVVAVLPGKTKSDEYVIFSGHYDHLGINSKRVLNGDSIYNGANDDAAGTTAVMMLAKYFKKINNNERTLIFAAFTAEEIGGYGSQYFSKQFNPDKVVAMFNIEMIGTESKWGTNSAFITGYEKTDMGKIVEKNLQGSAFKFYPDPYPEQELFYRSDNATLARLGVPAHTISTSKMDSEPNYHKLSDEIKTLDMNNMTEIIKAIAISAKSIIAGKDTPTRVNTADLR